MASKEEFSAEELAGMLVKAVFEHDLATVTDLVVNKKVPADTRTPDDMTMLMLAIREKQEKMAELLLKNGAAANGRSLSLTPLRLAVMSENVALVKMVLDAGADTRVVVATPGSMERYTEVEYAALSTNAIAALVSDASRKFQLHDAAEKGDSEKLKNLLDQHLPVDTVDRYNRTPLYYAVSKHNRKAAKLLLERGANPNILVPTQVPVLHTALFDQDLEMVKILGAGGADPDLPDMGGNTALQRVQKMDKPELTKAVMEIYELRARKRQAEIAETVREIVETKQDVQAPATASFRKRRAL